MKLSALSGASKRVEFDVAGLAGWCEYRVAFATPEFHQRFSKLRSVDDLVDGLPALVAALVAEWDLTDDDDQPIAVSEDVAGQLPYEYLQAMLGAIWGDQSVDPPKGATSAGG